MTIYKAHTFASNQHKYIHDDMIMLQLENWEFSKRTAYTLQLKFTLHNVQI
jgi:hypothetical protein